MSEVHKRLGKDQRNKFIKEFEQDGKLSDPNFYAIRDKKGRVQIRRKKAEKASEGGGQKPMIQIAVMPKGGQGGGRGGGPGRGRGKGPRHGGPGRR